VPCVQWRHDPKSRREMGLFATRNDSSITTGCYANFYGSSRKCFFRRAECCRPTMLKASVFLIAADDVRRHRFFQTLSMHGVAVSASHSVAAPELSSCGITLLDCDKETGRQMCSAMREFAGPAGILAVSRDLGSVARAALLEAGADLVLREPFSARELMGCVHALIRRTETAAKPSIGGERACQESALSDRIFIHDMRLNDLASSVGLTESERLLLRLLAAEGTVVSTGRLLEAVFPGIHHPPESSNLRVHMHRLRKKLRTRPSITERMIRQG